VTSATAAPSDSNRPSRPPAAGRCVAAWVLFLSVFVAGLTGDLITKSIVFDWLTRQVPTTGTRQIIPGVLSFTLSTNPGVVFGMDWIPDPVVVGATVAALGLVVYFFAASGVKARATHVALGMILAGAIGNLYDRLFTTVQLPNRPAPSVRQVRDFIDFSQLHIGPVNYPWVFNVADVLLVVGVGILLIVSLIQWRRERREAKARQAAN